MNTIVKDYRLINKHQWNSFVLNHPDGNIFHSPEMVHFYNSSSNRESIVIACFNDLNDITGIIVAEIQREYRGVIGNVTARAIVMGGPLVKDQNPEIALILIKEFDKVCRKKVVFNQYRNLWSVNEFKSIFASCNYVFEEHLDIITDLTLSEDNLWKNIVSNGRNKINKSVKSGTSVKLIENKDLLKDVYAILEHVYKKVRLPLPDFDYFENAWDELSPLGYLKCFGAFNHNILIGVRIELIYNKKIYDWYAGSRAEYYDKNPNDILPWEIIKWGAANGFTSFDFGGAGKPDKPYGVREFKIKYGGSLVNYGRFEKIHKPFTYKVAKIGFNFWKLLKF